MSKSISLQFPILVDGESISEVTLQRLKVKDLENLPEALFDDEANLGPHEMVPLICTMTGISKEDIGAMDLADLTKVGEEVGSFLETSLQTGKK